MAHSYRPWVMKEAIVTQMTPMLASASLNLLQLTADNEGR
ncbi:hypothetical protein W04_1328 [Pseudoalteromonas sp. SW0106-04]|nr:hypothetical protein W04_1328 [Pseudoalteromonas sp. SW0106-04]